MASSAWCGQFESLIGMVLSCPALSNSDNGKYKMCDMVDIIDQNFSQTQYSVRYHM